ncbi:energy-coupling factor transporter transmembrane protein EcfT [Mycoplasma sp. Ms02]|uniref:energy-coupling factor transporter transmembrane component T family protein n=1 Tax=Mycoplasma sp. Ms02 TaxID=353851 RepID=UPI001C88F94E|nr:energy-coupling factor transporter transmembrane component T [Mycoplasma sp. Ms02]QZE12375.1 energy-coupling factor transporter transmembrane protein EcfT [Mycoplasma sp. Ms02]
MRSVFGRFIPGDGLLYKIDPRVKIATTIMIIVAMFLARYIIDLTILLAFLMILYIATTRKIVALIRLIKFPILISIFILAMNLYSFKYGKDYVYDAQNQAHNYKEIVTMVKDVKVLIWPKMGIGITFESLNKTLSLFVRIYGMIITTTLLTNTTKPILITKGIEDLLLPLKLIKVPVHIVAMIISVALRFIPTLLDEANRIIKAQSSRGVDFKNGNMKDKITAFTTLIIPLFISSFSKAEELSYAMETRGYDPYGERTRYRKLKLHFRDLVFFLIIVGLLTAVIYNSVHGGFNFVELTKDAIKESKEAGNINVEHFMWRPSGYLPIWYKWTAIL